MAAYLPQALAAFGRLLTSDAKLATDELKAELVAFLRWLAAAAPEMAGQLAPEVRASSTMAAEASPPIRLPTNSGSAASPMQPTLTRSSMWKEMRLSEPWAYAAAVVSLMMAGRSRGGGWSAPVQRWVPARAGPRKLISALGRQKGEAVIRFRGKYCQASYE